MQSWFSQNLPTLITGAVVAALVAVAIWSLVRNKKKGKNSCGCDCGSCALAGTCHDAPAAEKKPLPKDLVGITKTVLKIDGMMCGMCEAHINDAVRAAFPVKKVTSSHTKGETVIFSPAPLDEAKLREVISATGYTLVSVSTYSA